MQKYFSLSKKEFLLLAAYSFIFPITNLIGGTLMLIGIFITLPFMGLAGVGGLLSVKIVDNENVYIWGVSITIFIQVWLIYLLYKFFKNKISTQKE